MQDASDMQTTVTDLLNHHSVSLLDLAHMVNASPGAVCALVAGLLDDDELAEQLIHGLEQLIAEEETEDDLDVWESEET